MAKVYDALRRAERERSQRQGEPAEPGGMSPFGAPLASQLPRRREPIFERLFGGRRIREEGPDLNKRRIVLLQPRSFAAEQFRSLRGRLDAIAAQQPLRTITVCSPLAGDGKTTAAVNLAAVTSLSVDRRVLLVDCDLRRPKIHTSLSLRPEVGLGEILMGSGDLDRAIIPVEGMRLDVLGVRGRPSNPSELLSSPAMAKLVEELTRRYDRIIFDTPAVLGVPDAKAVADVTDGILLIVRADSTSQHDIETAMDILGRDKMIGVVMNGVQVEQARYGYYST